MIADITKFGESVKKLREQSRMTREELGERVGLTSTTISSYEKGQKKPTLESALSIASAFGVTVDEMCGVRLSETDDFGQFIPMFVRLLKSKALYQQKYYEGDFYSFDYFDIHPAFSNFKNAIIKLNETLQAGHIDQTLFDLWVIDQSKKYSGVSISTEIESCDVEKEKERAGDGSLPF